MIRFSTLLIMMLFAVSSLSAQVSKTNSSTEKDKNLNTKTQDSILPDKPVTDTELQEIVVSATRQPEILDEVPSSVTLLSKKQLQQQLSISSNLSDILGASVPGLGFTTNRTQNLGQTLRGRRVLVMIDGIPQSTPLRDGAKDMRSLDPTVLDRVEVIKGATAIYGNGADGGLINYITKKLILTKQ